jgi:hypothetical protein
VSRELGPKCLLVVLIAGAIGALGPIAQAQDTAGETAHPVYFGASAGWSFRDGGADGSASTLLRTNDANGALLLYCEGGELGFHLSLGATERRRRAGSEDGILAVYALDEPEPGVPLGQFGVRFFTSEDMRSTRLRQPEWDDPARLAEILARHGAGLRFVLHRIRQDAFQPSRVVDLHLPAGTDGAALPMGMALAALDDACGRGSVTAEYAGTGLASAQ